MQSTPSLSRSHVLLEKGGWDTHLLFFRKILPILFCPHSLTNCHTITSRFVTGGGNGGSWKFPFADQSKGYTISGLLAKPQEGQTGPWGVGNFCSASIGTVSGFSCLRGWQGGSLSLQSPLTVPGSLLRPHVPNLEAPINNIALWDPGGHNRGN